METPCKEFTHVTMFCAPFTRSLRYYKPLFLRSWPYELQITICLKGKGYSSSIKIRTLLPCRLLDKQNNHSKINRTSLITMRKPKDQVSPSIKLHEKVVRARFVILRLFWYLSFIVKCCWISLVIGRKMTMLNNITTPIGAIVEYRYLGPDSIHL